MVAANIEALLFRETFAPLAKAIGFYGETVVAAATRAMVAANGSDVRVARSIEPAETSRT
ncbi:MAG: hypothetical protein NVS4B5_22190 [Vulcanimicrobiaceae bacterium]